MDIHFEMAGEGPALVLLHGIGSNSKSWRRQLADLSTGFRVIAWDAPGYGRSAGPPAVVPSMQVYVDSLQELLGSLHLERVALLGHSMGGVIAQEFYRNHPECLSALILADTSHGGGRHQWGERIQNIRTMTPAQLARQRAPKLLSPDAAEDVVGEAVSIMAEVRPAGYEFAAQAMAGADTRAAIRDIRIPTLLIWGAEDKITPMWHDIPRNAQLRVISGAGHLCYAERAAEFNDIVREFLMKVTTGQGLRS